MTIDKPGPLDSTLRIAPAAGSSPRASAAAPGFQALLAALERLRLHGGIASGTQAVQDLDRAVGAADDAHRATMDLKHRLEEAFRRALGET
jgi:hypothetical protein